MANAKRLKGRQALQDSEVAVTWFNGKRWQWYWNGCNFKGYGDFKYSEDVISDAFAHGYGTVIHNGKRLQRQ